MKKEKRNTKRTEGSSDAASRASAPAKSNEVRGSGREHSGDDALRLDESGLVYELERPPRKDGRRVLVMVREAASGSGDGRGGGGGEGRGPVRDLVNLYAHRSRARLAELVAGHFGREARDVMGHLDLLLDQVERALACAPRREAVVLDASRRAAAERLLAAPDLLDRVAAAIEALGFVGEERAKKLAYLVAVSRLLERPLSAILVAPLSSGKSELLERIVALMPEESVEFLSRLTPQALFYAGREHLAHKLVVVDEEVGAAEAQYPIRSLQSGGVLRLSATVRGRIESFETRGPIALLSSTTRHDLNAENLSRCLELALDDGPEQTSRVLEAQRRAWAGEAGVRVDAQLWHDAQRLLEPVAVVIPYATKLRYPSRTARDRRDHAKLGSLIAAHALLHARQRERDASGRLVATARDYAAVYELVAPLVDAELDGISPRAVALYRHFVESGAVALTRREAAAVKGWSYASALRALGELVAQELVVATKGEKPVRYRLLERSLLRGAPCLSSPEELFA